MADDAPRPVKCPECGARNKPEAADNGPGIPEALRERVFDPFFTTRPAGTGTGVGLALCRTIVQDHAGTIEALETPGGGATLLVRLPLPDG